MRGQSAPTTLSYSILQDSPIQVRPFIVVRDVIIDSLKQKVRPVGGEISQVIPLFLGEHVFPCADRFWSSHPPQGPSTPLFFFLLLCFSFHPSSFFSLPVYLGSSVCAHHAPPPPGVTLSSYFTASPIPPPFRPGSSFQGWPICGIPPCAGLIALLAADVPPGVHHPHAGRGAPLPLPLRRGEGVGA